jgi:ABC-type sugar transport system substrate-binding protein
MKKTLLVMLMAVALVAACGGGGGAAQPPATSQVPASASQSIDGFISYLQELVASAADMLEPVDTTNVVGPTDETSEPKVVD